MKDTITSHKFYAVWEYKREERDLNEASKNGLQLVKGGCFHSVFRKDDRVRYIYQLDYCPKISDKDRYIECFQDAGWEYVNSTFNGWHYFRRPYVPELSSEDIKIYTDRDSLYAMENRWCRVLRILSISTLIMGLLYIGILLYRHNIANISKLIYTLEMTAMFILSATFFMALKNISRTRQGEEAGFMPPVQVIFPLVLFLVIFCFILTFIS